MSELYSIIHPRVYAQTNEKCRASKITILLLRCEKKEKANLSAVFFFSASGAGQQCCYNGDSLMVGPPGGGSLDVVSPDESFWGHMGRDVLPWYACCKFTENCGKYYERRPSDDGSRYVPPRPGKLNLFTS